MGQYLQSPGSGLYVPAAGPITLLTNLISHWKLDEATGTRVDEMGTNDLSDVNGVGQSTGKVSGNSALFVRTSSQALEKADGASVRFGPKFSVAGWAFLNTNTTSKDFASKADGSVATSDWEIQHNNSTFLTTFRTYSGGTATVSTTSNTQVDGSWFFIAAYLDEVNDIQGIKLNGNAFDTTANTNTMNTSATSPFRLGGRNGGMFLDGRLDSWSVWTRVLTANEFTALYNGGAGLAFANFNQSF